MTADEPSPRHGTLPSEDQRGAGQTPHVRGEEPTQATPDTALPGPDREVAPDAEGTPREGDAAGSERRRRRPQRALYRDIPKGRLVWLLGKDTVKSCSEHRVMGMAAESAFFTLLSLPPLLLGLVGLLTSLDAAVGTNTMEITRHHILDAASRMLSERGVDDVVRPLIDDLVQGARPDIMSVGFIIALWSGSRAFNVFVGTITVMYGMEGYRNPAATRVLAFTMYVVALSVGVVAVPAMVLGPDLAIERFPGLEGQLRVFYWPLLLLICTVFLTTLYHVSVPVRSPWREDLPGALVALGIWAVCAVALRTYLHNTVEEQSMYGSLAVPVAILMWLAMSAFAVLVGAALNAAVDRVWPTATTAAARAETDRAREAAARAMAEAVRDRQSRAEKRGVEAFEVAVVAQRMATQFRPSELKHQLREARLRRRREAKARRQVGRGRSSGS